EVDRALRLASESSLAQAKLEVEDVMKLEEQSGQRMRHLRGKVDELSRRMRAASWAAAGQPGVAEGAAAVTPAAGAPPRVALAARLAILGGAGAVGSLHRATRTSRMHRSWPGPSWAHDR
ncbi:unnamed protein product, partial [Prorocentrum cordatum]